MIKQNFHQPENTSVDTPTKFGDGFDDGSKITAKNLKDETGRLFSYYDSKLKGYESKIGALEKNTEELDKNIKETRTDSTKLLAVFVAFFTFVSLSFSILPQITHPLVLLGVVLVLLACMTFFILLLTWATNDAKSPSITPKQIGVLFVFFMLLFIGIVISSIGYNEMRADELENQDNFYTKEEIDEILKSQINTFKDEMDEMDNSTKFQQLLEDFKKCIANRGLSACIVD